MSHFGSWVEIGEKRLQPCFTCQQMPYFFNEKWTSNLDVKDKNDPQNLNYTNLDKPLTLFNPQTNGLLIIMSQYRISPNYNGTI